MAIILISYFFTSILFAWIPNLKLKLSFFLPFFSHFIFPSCPFLDCSKSSSFCFLGFQSNFHIYPCCKISILEAMPFYLIVGLLYQTISFAQLFHTINCRFFVKFVVIIYWIFWEEIIAQIGLKALENCYCLHFYFYFSFCYIFYNWIILIFLFTLLLFWYFKTNLQTICLSNLSNHDIYPFWWTFEIQKSFKYGISWEKLFRKHLKEQGKLKESILDFLSWMFNFLLETRNLKDKN